MSRVKPEDPSAADTVLRDHGDGPCGTPTVPGRGPTPAKANPFQAGATISRYLILAEAGAGGMGVVYAAYDPQLDRKVAIKLLHSESADSARDQAMQQRLLREAQAMARVTHPNVIGVHDVGIAGDQVFMAMDFVEGETLDDWMEANKPSWREVLRRFAEAGRGLGAAHAVGLVHRDFKPANVLVGRDGSVRVTDFGLARAEDGKEDAASRPQEMQALRVPTALDLTLTATGTFLGTPAFMSPEQLAGEAADARSDQFSFCVALYEALYGDRPFPGKTVEELSEAIAGGKVRDPPRSTQVPSWVRRALLRGLAAAPAERWPAMNALLDALTRDPAVAFRRRLVVVAAIEALAAVTLSWRAVAARGGQVCVSAGGEVDKVWNDLRRDQVRAAFAATGSPLAQSTWDTVEERLDGYAAGWRAMRREACEATRVRGAQSGELLDLRMECLDHRLAELSALTDILAKADAKVVDGAVSAAFGLSALSPCANGAALRAIAKPEADAWSRTRSEEVRANLAQAKELQEAGKYPEGLAEAELVVDGARSLRYAPLLAEALTRLGELQDKMGRRADAEKSLQEAVTAAEAGSDDATAAQAWSLLALVVGLEQGKSEEGRVYASYAEAALRRQGGNAAIEGQIHHTLGLILSDEGRYAEAVNELETALALADRLDSRILGGVQWSLAQALWDARADRSRARSLAAQARENFSRRPGTREKVAEVDAWLQSRQ
jgi:eukaryotic-like serine/threonine-protein kinase